MTHSKWVLTSSKLAEFALEGRKSKPTCYMLAAPSVLADADSVLVSLEFLDLTEVGNRVCIVS